MTSRRDLGRFRKAADESTRRAQDDLRAAFDRLLKSGVPMEDVRDGMIEATFAVSSKYGDMTASAAADWYNEVRPSGLGRFTAKLGPTADIEQVEGGVRYAARHLFTGEPENMLRDLNGMTQRFVENAGRDTITLNAKRDSSKPSFARVPSGGKTCAFCGMLASRGFVYASAEKAGSEGQYHDDCRCMVVPGWGDNPQVAGYDPDEWRKAYYEALVPGDVNATLANMRRQNPGMFTDGIQPVSVSSGVLRGDTAFARSVGEAHLRTLNEALAASPHTDTVELFTRYQDEFRFTSTAKGNKAYFSGTDPGVTLDLESVMVQSPHKAAGEMVFHEFGHMTDWLLNEKDPRLWFSSMPTESGRTLADALKKDAQAVYRRHEVLAREDVIRQGERIRRKVDRFGMSGLSDDDWDWMLDHGGDTSKWVAGGKPDITLTPTADEVVRSISGEIQGLPDRTATMDDMFEGQFPLQFSGRRGHGVGYWRTPNMQEKEAFAEMIEAQLSNPELWDAMVEYFPTATDVFKEMVKGALNV